jgi:hypothetical protein
LPDEKALPVEGFLSGAETMDVAALLSMNGEFRVFYILRLYFLFELS